MKSFLNFSSFHLLFVVFNSLTVHLNAQLFYSSCESGTYLPHPFDCSKFTICGDESRRMYRCAAPYLFNRETRKCDWAYNVACNPMRAEPTLPNGIPSTFPSSLPSTFPSTFPSNMPSTFPSTMPSTFPSTFPSSFPGSLPTTLPSIPYEYIICAPGLLIPHPTDCSLFIKCGPTDLENIMLRCPSPTVFNRNTLACDIPPKVQCKTYTYLLRPTAESMTTSTPSLETLYCRPGCLIPHQTECNKFILCGKTLSDNIVFTCPTSLLYNPYIKSCDLAMNVVCQTYNYQFITDILNTVTMLNPNSTASPITKTTTIKATTNESVTTANYTNMNETSPSEEGWQNTTTKTVQTTTLNNATTGETGSTNEQTEVESTTESVVLESNSTETTLNATHSPTNSYSIVDYETTVNTNGTTSHQNNGTQTTVDISNSQTSYSIGTNSQSITANSETTDASTDTISTDSDLVIEEFEDSTPSSENLLAKMIKDGFWMTRKKKNFLTIF